jgi:chaperone modulatory protein CbpM
MTELHVEWVWSGARKAVNQAELSRVCAMTGPELEELMEYGALSPLEPLEPSAVAGERLFTAECIAPMRTAGKLRRDFDLDLFAVAFLLDYLNRIEVLEDQVRSLQAHVSARTLASTL